MPVILTPRKMTSVQSINIKELKQTFPNSQLPAILPVMFGI
nr:MAG TPA: hypothetical protein [Bacteriophage sp.]